MNAVFRKSVLLRLHDILMSFDYFWYSFSLLLREWISNFQVNAVFSEMDRILWSSYLFLDRWGFVDADCEWTVGGCKNFVVVY